MVRHVTASWTEEEAQQISEDSSLPWYKRLQQDKASRADTREEKFMGLVRQRLRNGHFKSLDEDEKAEALEGEERAMPEALEGDEKVAATAPESARLMKYLNKPQHFHAFRELTINSLIGPAPNDREHRATARGHHQLRDANYNGLEACHATAEEMRLILTGIGLEAKAKRVTKRRAGDHTDHAWTLVTQGNEKIIVDGSWKQFWVTEEMGANPRHELWGVLNEQPNIFVGTLDELRERVTRLNTDMGEPFTEVAIKSNMEFYDLDKAKTTYLGM